MAGEPTITIIGNLGGDPTLRFTANGDAVVNFSVAQTPRRFDRQSNQWVDDEALWFRCNAWREMAENIAETFTKGMRVIVTGRLKASAYEDKQGNPRVGWELTVEEAGPSLRWSTAQVNRKQAGGNASNQNYAQNNPWGNSQYNQQQGQPPQQQQQQQPQQGQDPWGAAPAGNGSQFNNMAQQYAQQPGQAPAQQQGPPPGQEGNVWAGGQPGGNPPQQDAFGFDNNGPPPF